MPENLAIEKLNPNHCLSTEQICLQNKLIAFCETHLSSKQNGVFILKGAAGTGKSLVVTTSFTKIQKLAQTPDSPLYQTKNYCLVNHPEVLKLYKQIAGETAYLLKKNFQRPTTFINQMTKQGQKADIVFIDEAHLLLSKADPYNHFYGNNQLTEILKLSKIVILIFDPHQSLKAKSYWDITRLKKTLPNWDCEVMSLNQQFRMNAPLEVSQWIEALTQKKLTPFPNSDNYDLQIFQSANMMYQTLLGKNNNNQLSRILATCDFFYKLDGKDYFVKTKDFCLRWDRALFHDPLAWAERKNTIEEIGSVYTIQGFDLNYAAVIIGPSIYYSRTEQKIKINSDLYQDKAAFAGAKDFPNPDKIKEAIMLNALYVLLTRGKNGLFIYAYDSELRQKLIALQMQKVGKK